MAIFSKAKLSGSTDGRAITITATAAATGTVLHTATGAGTVDNSFDELHLWAVCTASVGQQIVIAHGGTATGDLIPVTIPPSDGLYHVMPGLLLANNLAARGYVTATAGVGQVMVHGFVNKVRP